MRARAWILGLLISTDHEVAGVQQLALPAALIQIEHRCGALCKPRVAREDPRAMLPGPDRILRQPARDRRGRRVGDTTLDDQPVQLSAGEARQRHALILGQLASDRLDLGDLLRGETARATRARPVLQPLQAALAEASSPLRNDLRRRVQPRGDLLVLQPLGRIQHDPRSLHLSEGGRQATCDRLKLRALPLAELDRMVGDPRHARSRSPQAT